MFVQNVSTGTPNPSLTFVEARKSNSTSTSTVFSTSPNQDLKVQLNLYTSDNDLRDGVIVRMGDNYSDSVGDEDAIKLWNYLESFAVNNNGNYLTSDRRVLDDNNENVELFITNYTQEDYTFRINVNNPDNKTIYLLDTYLGTQTLLDNSYHEVSFSVDQSAPASIATDRFQLIFENTTLGNARFELSGIEIYPNPVQDILSINKGNFNGEWRTLGVYDITGKQVLSLNNLDQDDVLDLDMSALSNGLYILKLNTSNGQYQKKLIKE
jgi:hypothetical protein